MERPKFFTPKFIENAIRYAVYFCAVAITPFLALPIAPLFDWAGYSLMRPLFAEIFTCIFWGLEALAFRYFGRKLRRKYGVEETPLKTEEEGGVSETNAEVKSKRRPPLPLKNVGILTAIAVACIFTISAIIGFQVKPFYDIGEKVTGYQLFNALGAIGRNIFKCLWIVSMAKACTAMAEEFVREQGVPENKRWLSWLIAGGFLLVFGLFDVFASVVAYPLGLRQALIALAYILFYVVFAAIYRLTEKNYAKSYLLIMLIYLF